MWCVYLSQFLPDFKFLMFIRCSYYNSCDYWDNRFHKQLKTTSNKSATLIFHITCTYKNCIFNLLKLYQTFLLKSKYPKTSLLSG